MVKMKEGLFGDFSGRMGNLVIYRLYGKTVIRSMPAVKPKKATGEKLKSQQDFAFVMRCLKDIKAYIQHGFYYTANGRSAFHEAMSVNLQRYRDTEDKSIGAWLQISRGERAGAVGFRIEKNVNGDMVLHWEEAHAGKPQSPSDSLMILLVNTVSPASGGWLRAAKRSDGCFTMDKQDFCEGDTVSVIVSFYKPDESNGKVKSRTGISDSQYAGSITI